MATSAGQLKTRDFLFFCEEHALARLDRAQVPPQRKLMWTILQLSFGDPAIHFELQPQLSRGLIEIGLHFESKAEVNDAWAARISGHAAPLIGELGPGWELEAWTVSWRRLHRSYPAKVLTTSLGLEVAQEFARAVAVLGPIVEEGLEGLALAGALAIRAGAEYEAAGRRLAGAAAR